MATVLQFQMIKGPHEKFNDYSKSLLFFSQTLVYNMEDNEGRGATPQCDNDPNFDYNMEMDAHQATDRKKWALENKILCRAGHFCNDSFGFWDHFIAYTHYWCNGVFAHKVIGYSLGYPTVYTDITEFPKQHHFNTGTVVL